MKPHDDHDDSDLPMSIRYRLAKLSDIKSIAQLHWESSKRQPESFMFKLGYRFLVRYYECVMRERYSLVLCAEDQNGSVLGFVSGSIDASERSHSLRANKVSLLLAAVPQIILKPKLIKEIFSRYYSASSDVGVGYVVQFGPHEDFWAWSGSHDSGNASIILHLNWLKTMKLFGVDKVKGEVDDENKLILRIHRMLGAEIIKQYETPDGRKRRIFEYDLEKIE